MIMMIFLPSTGNRRDREEDDIEAGPCVCGPCVWGKPSKG